MEISKAQYEALEFHWVLKAGSPLPWSRPFHLHKQEAVAGPIVYRWLPDFSAVYNMIGILIHKEIYVAQNFNFRTIFFSLIALEAIN